jgi:hypothetical protein
MRTAMKDDDGELESPYVDGVLARSRACPVVYECGAHCTSAPTCGNRVIQQYGASPPYRLQVFKVRLRSGVAWTRVQGELRATTHGGG